MLFAALAAHGLLGAALNVPRSVCTYTYIHTYIYIYISLSIYIYI